MYFIKEVREYKRENSKRYRLHTSEFVTEANVAAMFNGLGVKSKDIGYGIKKYEVKYPDVDSGKVISVAVYAVPDDVMYVRVHLPLEVTKSIQYLCETEGAEAAEERGYKEGNCETYDVDFPDCSGICFQTWVGELSDYGSVEAIFYDDFNSELGSENPRGKITGRWTLPAVDNGKSYVCDVIATV